MVGFQGNRLPDTKLGEFPTTEDPPPGSYWKVISRKDDREMNVIDYPEDRHYWTALDSQWEGNLTGTVWGYISPNGMFGMMSIHTVREESDGTISVRPGDGSSNSILISQNGSDPKTWHGYIEHGIWSEC